MPSQSSSRHRACHVRVLRGHFRDERARRDALRARDPGDGPADHDHRRHPAGHAGRPAADPGPARARLLDRRPRLDREHAVADRDRAAVVAVTVTPTPTATPTPTPTRRRPTPGTGDGQDDRPRHQDPEPTAKDAAPRTEERQQGHRRGEHRVADGQGRDAHAARRRRRPVPDDQAQPPAQDDPTFSLAEPGAAKPGVPNFFIDRFKIPPFLLPIYQAAGTEYGIRWEVLAAINEIETNYGRNLNVSSAGARGLDAVHARDLEGLRGRRQQGRPRRSVQPGRRDLRRRALPEGRRRRQGPARRGLRLQPRRLVRGLGAPARPGHRRHADRASCPR